jgi:hypothetical protein
MPSRFCRTARTLLLGAALALPAVSARAAPGCPATAAPVRINLSLPPPVLDNSLPRAAIQLKSPHSHGGHTVGLYIGTLKSSLAIDFRTLTMPGRSCVAVAGATINLGIADRRIYLAQEWPAGSCPYRAILEHERKHQAADDRALKNGAQAMRAEIGAAIGSLGPLLVPSSAEKSARQRLFDAVNSAFHAGTARLLLDQGRLQQEVDAGFEYARLTASCSEFEFQASPYAPLPPKGADDPPLLPGLR